MAAQFFIAGQENASRFADQFFSPTMRAASSWQRDAPLDPGAWPSGETPYERGHNEPADAPEGEVESFGRVIENAMRSLGGRSEGDPGPTPEDIARPRAALEGSTSAANWLDMQRVGFVALGILLLGIGAAAIAAPRLGFGSFREEWLRSSLISSTRAGRRALEGDGKKRDGKGSDKPPPILDGPPDGGDDPRPGPFAFSSDVVEGELSPRVGEAAKRAGEAAKKVGRPKKFKGRAKRYEMFKGAEPRPVLEFDTPGGKEGTKQGVSDAQNSNRRAGPIGRLKIPPIDLNPKPPREIKD